MFQFEPAKPALNTCRDDTTPTEMRKLFLSRYTGKDIVYNIVAIIALGIANFIKLLEMKYLKRE
jgi:hypothetical protein